MGRVGRYEERFGQRLGRLVPGSVVRRHARVSDATRVYCVFSGRRAYTFELYGLRTGLVGPWLEHRHQVSVKDDQRLRVCTSSKNRRRKLSACLKQILSF
ncbi:unnamed protein product [Hapterophycus canaliculatus]